MLYNTTNGQKFVAMPEPNISTLSRCWDVANFCPLTVLYNTFVAGVRVVEFGTKPTNTLKLFHFYEDE